jgi:hypothetical protein
VAKIGIVLMPKGEPMRLIDADKLCEDLLNRWSIADTRKEELIRQIMADIVTPIVVSQPTINWIPCSERLPEDRDWYLGIFKELDTGWINPIPYICDYVGHETKATTKDYWILKDCTDRDEHIDYYFNLECVAWQPLPNPYQEEIEGETEND